MNDDTTAHQPGRAGICERIVRGLTFGALALLAVVLVANFSSWVSAASFAVQYPYQIDYGEGIVWQQALLILGGEGYSDITRLPYVVFHYPPVFHLLSGLFAGALNIDLLAAGRMVSVVSTLGATLIIGVLIFRAVRARDGLAPALICAFAAGLTVYMFEPVAKWSPVMRVDMAAIFLSYLGIYFGLQAPERPRSVYVSALFFLLAMYTKQTMIAAPLAMLLVLLVIRPRLAARGVFTALGFGLLAMLVLELSTDGGFLKHIVSYNINRFELSRLQFLILPALQHLLYLFIITVFLIGFFVSLTRRDPGLNWLQTLRKKISADQYDRLRCFGFLYILLTTLSLIALTKSGGSTNYLLEWMFTWSIAIGLLLRRPTRFAIGGLGAAKRPEPAGGKGGVHRRFFRFDFPVLVAALLLQALLISPPAYRSIITNAAYLEQQRALLRRVREASKPVIGDDMVAILRSGKQVLWEPAIFAELAVLERWDEGPFIQMIRSNDFAFFVTRGQKGDPLFDSRYTAPVVDAIEGAYPRTEQLAGYILHLPPE